MANQVSNWPIRATRHLLGGALLVALCLPLLWLVAKLHGQYAGETDILALPVSQQLLIAVSLSLPVVGLWVVRRWLNLSQPPHPVS